MLVLSRKATQQIQIGENIVVTIVQVKGQGVKIGIEAPDDVRIVRSEIAGGPNKPVAGEASPAKEAGDRGRPPRKPRSGMTPTRIRREASPDDCFSPPVFSVDEPDSAPPIGESSGLFPRLRERASRMSDRDGPVADFRGIAATTPLCGTRHLPRLCPSHR